MGAVGATKISKPQPNGTGSPIPWLVDQLKRQNPFFNTETQPSLLPHKAQMNTMKSVTKQNDSCTTEGHTDSKRLLWRETVLFTLMTITEMNRAGKGKYVSSV